MDIYDRLGVKKFVNAMGTISVAGGSVMPPQVYEAMRQANESYVFIDELDSGKPVGETCSPVPLPAATAFN